MDLGDFDDPMYYADPDYGGLSHAATRARDLWDRGAQSAPTHLDDDAAWSDDEGSIYNAEGGPELASDATLHSVRRALDASTRHDRIRRALERDEDFEQSLGLPNLFYPEEQCSSSSPAPPRSGVVEDQALSRDEMVRIAAESHAYLHLLDEAALWIRSVPPSALPSEDRELWGQLAWELFVSAWPISGLASTAVRDTALESLAIPSPQAFYRAVATDLDSPASTVAESSSEAPSVSHQHRHRRGGRRPRRS